MQWKRQFLPYVTSPKPLTLVTSLCFLNSSSASSVLCSLGDLVPSHYPHADDSHIQTTLPSCMPHTNCLQDKLYLTDTSINISKTEPITFSSVPATNPMSCVLGTWSVQSPLLGECSSSPRPSDPFIWLLFNLQVPG